MAGKETKILMSAFMQKKAPTLFFRDRYFTNVRSFDQSTVEFDIVEASRRMADYNVRGAEARPITRKGYKTYAYKPPVLNDKHVLSYAECASAVAGENIYSPLSPQARADIHRLEAGMEMIDAFNRREEYQAFEALFNMEISIPVTGDTITFPKDTDLIGITPDNDWDTASATIIDDVASACFSVYTKSGEVPTEIVLGEDALAAFMEDETVLSQLDNRRFFKSELMGADLGNGAFYVGTFQFRTYILDVFAYNGLVDIDGTPTRYMPAKKALLINPNSRRDRVYGGIEANGVMSAVPQYLDTWEVKDPDGWKVRAQSAPLVIPVSLYSHATIQCIAE